MLWVMFFQICHHRTSGHLHWRGLRRPTQRTNWAARTLADLLSFQGELKVTCETCYDEPGERGPWPPPSRHNVTHNLRGWAFALQMTPSRLLGFASSGLEILEWVALPRPMLCSHWVARARTLMRSGTSCGSRGRRPCSFSCTCCRSRGRRPCSIPCICKSLLLLSCWYWRWPVQICL